MQHCQGIDIQMTLNKNKPITDIDTLAAILSIQQMLRQGVSAVPELIGILADGNPGQVAAAREALFALVPLAALPIRWPPVHEPPTVPSVLPSAFNDVCRGWIDDTAFAELCVRALAELSADGQKDFLLQLAAFQGLEPAFCAALEQDGRTGVRTLYLDGVRELRQAQFPLQLSLSLTMACQLNCSYCISAGMAADVHNEMSLATAEAVLDWAVQRGVRRIGFTGGEPTLYSRFDEIVRMIRGKGMQWYLATNGLVSTQRMAEVAGGKPLFVTMHLAPEILASQSHLELYVKNAMVLAENQTPVAMRVNFDHPDTDLETVFDIARRAGIGEIRAAIPVPNIGRNNQYVRFDRPEAFGTLLDRFVKSAGHAGIRPILTKPFFPCKLPPEALRTFLSNGSLSVNCPVHLHEFSNNMIVYPDATFLPCLGLSLRTRRSLLEYADLTAAASVFRPAVRDALHQPALTSCETCPLWTGGRCIGICPSYRMDRTGEGYPGQAAQ
jgi:MoaA/NifB/PqqE/SkfB family radical SAM enzyme